MTDTATVISKVLVLDSNPDCQQAIKDFCTSHHLSALRVNRGNLLSVLRSNVDLGAILIRDALAKMSTPASNSVAKCTPCVPNCRSFCAAKKSMDWRI